MEKLISWVEIPTADFHRAVKFYNNVFKMEMNGENFGVEKMACFPSGEGAIVYAPGYAPSQNGIIVSLLVPDSIELTVARIEKLGGKITQAKTKIEAQGMGYYAVFVDLEGNRIGLHEKL
jgi:predicted enzyme related to lactoylglutathione lyase